MSEPRHDLLSEHFLAATALEGESRRAYLRDLRGREPSLAAQVESLLRHDASIPSLLEPGVLADLGDCRLGPGDRVGPYHLVEVLGAGGMGIVFRAEQREPIRREVALKLIRGESPSGSMVARFEAERQVLERMEHPHIARLLDAGTTGEGRRYVVMEYVRGEPITLFCDRERLDLAQRLRLFLQVCAAVQHAHQNAILHRDIKPSNILVARVGDQVIPKIIDFGIAKTLVADPSPHQTLTDGALLVGTPAYMSPEQASPWRRDIDIRSDVYSLGAVLYEILIGRPPLDPDVLKVGGIEAFRRLLLDEEPAAPSRRLDTLGDGGAERVARARGIGRSALRRRLRGDLDGIALKALSRDRARRYGTAADLAQDIERHLKSEPIEARPPGRLYRLGKLVRKHRTASAVVMALAPTLVVFAAAMGIEARRLALERDRAEDLSRFLLRFYEVPYFVSGRHGPLNAAEVLKRGADKVERQLADRPLLQARLLHAVGVALRGTGGSVAAEPILAESEKRLQTLVGSDDPLTLAAAGDLARCAADNGKFDQAERQLAATLRTQRLRLGAEHLDTIRSARDLGILFKRVGRLEEAGTLLEEARRGLLAHLGAADPETAVTASLLGAVDLDLRRLDEADRYIREALDHLDAGNPERGMALYNVACIHALRGEKAAALAVLRDSLAAGFYISYHADRNLAPLFGDPEFEALAKAAFLRAPGIQYDLAEEASNAFALGRAADAEALYRYAMTALTPAGDAAVRMIRARLAHLYLREGRYAEALPYLQADLAWRRALAWPESASTIDALVYLGQAQFGGGHREEALQSMREMAEIVEREHGLGQPGWLHYSRACAEAIQGRPSGALRELRVAVDAGFSRVGMVRGAPMFAALRDEPAFQAMVREMEGLYEYRPAESPGIPVARIPPARTGS